MNFVFVSLQRINTNRESTSTSLAKELARQHHKVLYVNSPLDRKEYFFPSSDSGITDHLQVIKTQADPLQKLAPNLWVLYPLRRLDSFNWIRSTNLFSWLIKLNNRRLANDIKPALKELGFEEFILVNDKDIFRSFYLKEFLQPLKYIYLDRDYTIGMPYWRRHGQVLEPRLMTKADAIFCNSLDFTTNARRYNANSFYIGNGFAAKQFTSDSATAVPADLATIAGPRIGYVGALITLRLDLDLLRELAQERPGWSFVLIGWEDEDFAQSDLHKMPNVFFLGRKHTQEVHAYIQHFDVCINPQVLNDITRSNFPLKILEYLALGKPVVATTTNTMTEEFSNYTYLATNKEEYLQKIEQALQEESLQKKADRIQFVQKFSWENVVKLFVKHVDEVLAK
ncbi:glycosyltransferase family 1 protein [Hymenobacter sp. NBH84]|nr:glycosyltransferase family 1 protein [Hymenobacter sp. NBH84]